MNDCDAIEVHQIEANAVRAILAIRIVIDAVPSRERQTYRGEIYGPLAHDRTTLPASYRVPEFRAGEEVRAVVTDPCFWSPDSPLEYEILLTPVGEGVEAGETLRRRIRLRTRSELT
jgi:hypothetical protein